MSLSICPFRIHYLINVNNINFSKCFYGRWVHRQPVKVIFPNDSNQNDSEKITHDEKEVHITEKRAKNNEKISKYQPKKNLFDIDELDSRTFNQNNNSTHLNRNKKWSECPIEDVVLDANTGNATYTKLNDNSKIIGSYMLLVKSKKQREKKNCILLEGKRLIRDSLLAGCVPEVIFFTRNKELDYFKDVLPPSDVKLYKMFYKDLQLWSDLTTSPGIMGIFKIPESEMRVSSNHILPITVLCDNIREPGNLGAILRTAAAVGCRKVILTKGCVDLWDTKVLRSGAGAHFRTSITKNLPWDEIKSEIAPNSTIFLADNNNRQITQTETNITIPSFPYCDIDYIDCDSIVLVIGGETEGISEDALKLTVDYSGMRIHVPLFNGVESLNTGTALGVIAFEIRRQLMKGLKNVETNKNVLSV